jgi:REP element-mobilizing transposase RayT
MSRYFQNNTYYFITVPTVQRKRVFDTSEKKIIILKRIREGIKKFSLRKIDYGILANHYHIIGYFQHGNIIPRFLQHVNGGAAYYLHKQWGTSNSSVPIWDEYNIYCVQDELSLAKIRGYVVGNPLKHGDVSTFTELSQSPFSSYAQLSTRFDPETVQEWVRSVITMEEKDFINSLLKNSDLTKVS